MDCISKMTKFSVTVPDLDLKFDCAEGDTILRAALRAGVALPYECNSGGCGSCKVELISGSVLDRWPDAPGVSPRDARRNRKLSCQNEPVEDLSIKVKTKPPEIEPVKPRKSMIRFKGRRDLTHDMAEFYFISDEPADFFPGQFALLKLPGVSGDRAYSMSNLPNDRGEWHFIIKKMPGGQGSHWMFDQLEKEQSVELDGPFGHAHLRQTERDIICVAGGSGLSPVMSILRELTRNADYSGKSIHLFFGGRGPKDICTPELVGELSRDNVDLRCHEAISDVSLIGDEGWSGPQGFIHEIVAAELGETLRDYEIYFCGPPPMTEAVQQMLIVEHNVPFEQIHYDRFF